MRDDTVPEGRAHAAERAAHDAASAQPRTRRSLRRRAGEWTSAASPTRVVVRPPRTQVLLAAALALGIPVLSKSGPSLFDRALAAGPGSRQMTAVLVLWAGVVVWTALVLVRSRSTLSAGPGGPPVLDVRTVLRRRVTVLDHAARLVLLTVKPKGGAVTQRALLLDRDGRVLASPGAHGGLWQRADVQALLRGAGVPVGWDHRRTTTQDMEATYPGSSIWTDRHPVLLALAVVVGICAAIIGVGWLFDFGS